MSNQAIISQIGNIQREIQSYQRQLSNISKEIASSTGKISQIKRSITKSTSVSMQRNKMREIERLEAKIGKKLEKQAFLNKKIFDKTSILLKYERKLRVEQNKEQKRLYYAIRKKEREDQLKQDEMLRQIHLVSTADSMISENINTPQSYDAFISHASEDKDGFVRPLAKALHSKGVSVWYDEFQLKVGDSLRRSIDRGLAQSRFGIVVLSPDFFAKGWPQYELDGLVAKEITGGKVILPIWHKVSKEEVISYSPSLADKVALNTARYTIDELAMHLEEILKNH